MIKEDYVSFETAKLLKEKGFDELCSCVYLNNGERCEPKQYVYDRRDWENGFICPTLQMAMKWLREKHNLGVFPSWSQVFGLYECRMYYFKKGSQEFYSLGVRYNTYEDVCEAAIKYCLENLI